LPSYSHFILYDKTYWPQYYSIDKSYSKYSFANWLYDQSSVTTRRRYETRDRTFSRTNSTDWIYDLSSTNNEHVCNLRFNPSTYEFERNAIMFCFCSVIVWYGQLAWYYEMNESADDSVLWNISVHRWIYFSLQGPCFAEFTSPKISTIAIKQVDIILYLLAYYVADMSCNGSTNIFLLGLASSMKTDIRTSGKDQEQWMTFAYAMPVTLMVACAIVSNIMAIDTFRHVHIRSTTAGIYLLVYSGCSLFGILMLQCRLFQLLDSLTYIPFFIICNVVSSLASIFTRICLWMIGIIALQRSLFAVEHSPIVNKIRSRNLAPTQIIMIVVCVFSMHIHEVICRVTLPDSLAQGKFVCQIKYSSDLLTLNTVFIFLHLFVPFALNILANCVIVASISQRRASLHQTTYWHQWFKQFRTHGHLFLAPTLALVSIRSVPVWCSSIFFCWKINKQ
jgi:hypothetical protein